MSGSDPVIDGIGPCIQVPRPRLTDVPVAPRTNGASQDRLYTGYLPGPTYQGPCTGAIWPYIAPYGPDMTHLDPE